MKILDYAAANRPPRNLKARFITALWVLGLPWLSIVILGFFGGNHLSAPEIPGVFVIAIPNAVIVGLPQIICWLLRRFGKASAGFYYGGLFTAHMLLILFTILLLIHPGDGDSMCWLYYYAICIPLVPVGWGIGGLVGKLIRDRRQSPRSPSSGHEAHGGDPQ